MVGDLVIVAAAGHLVAYDTATGQPRWYGPKTAAGATARRTWPRSAASQQVLLLNGAGAIGVAPADGKVLWEHKWPGDAIVQPGLTADGDVLIGTDTGMGGRHIGMRRVAVTQGPAGWTVQERWTTTGLKPYFNDFVVHEGHAYGFDGSLARLRGPEGRRAQVEGRPLRRAASSSCSPSRTCCWCSRSRASSRWSRPRPTSSPRWRARPGHRGQDLEPPGAGRRRPPGPQRRGDGRFPPGPRQPLTEADRRRT